MKRLAGLILFLFAFTSYSQENPSEYMGNMSAYYKQINKDTWDYMKQSMRSRNGKRAEKRRMDLVKTMQKSRYEINKMPAYKGDASLRKSVVSFLDLAVYSLNNDYKKITLKETHKRA
ncbi:MAG: hypothetical protein ABJN36_05115 [Cyclobacteriaceae bacterium]